jgi:hypothetical protein
MGLLSPQLHYEDFVSMHYAAWRQELPKVSPPLMEPRPELWDADVHAHGTVLLDPRDGVFKAWYVSTPANGLTPGTSAESGRVLCYAFSRDGTTWQRPSLDVVQWHGQPSNILLALPGEEFVQYASVFVDANSTSAQPYEMFVLCSSQPPGFEPARCPSRCLYRYRSTDGIHWMALEIVLGFPEGGTDGLYVFRDDGSERARYTAYIKTDLPAPAGGFVPYDIGAGKQRVISRSISVDGSSWSAPQLVATADWRDAQGDQLVELGVTPTVPSAAAHRPRAEHLTQTPPLLVGVFTVIHTTSQTIEVQFGASRDGLAWWRPTRRAAVPLAALGDFGGGITWPMRTLVSDPNGSRSIHLYYSGTEGLHASIYDTMPSEAFGQCGIGEGRGCWDFRDMRWGGGTTPRGHEQLFSLVSNNVWFRGAIMRATWEDGRLWGVVPAVGGEVPATVLTRNLSLGAGDEQSSACVVVDAVTVRNGSLLAEVVVAATGQVLPGFTLSDSLPFDGNEHNTTLRWRGKGSQIPIGALKGGRVQVRFSLLRARLYHFSLLPAPDA